MLSFANIIGMLHFKYILD